MFNTTALDDSDAAAILAAAAAESTRNAWRVSIALVDAGGHLLAFMRQTAATPLSAQIACAKARTAAMSGRDTAFFEDLVRQGKTGFLSVPDMALLEGGVPVLVAGRCVGGIGVSGATSEQDAQVARAGLRALEGRAA